MKLPDIFVPKKDLERKTQEFLEEKNIKKSEQQEASKNELEKLFEIFNRRKDSYGGEDELHRKVNELMDKADYKPVRLDVLKNHYWYKPRSNDSYEHDVLIRYVEGNNICYAFGRTDDNKTEKFCKLFDKHIRPRSTKVRTLIDLNIIAGGTGGVMLFAAGVISGLAVPVVPFTTLVSTIAYYRLKSYVNHKKMLNQCEELTYNEAKSLRYAFT